MLVKTNEPEGTWYPVSISKLEELLIKVISTGYGYPNPYALRKNIAYNLQYIEFLHRCLSDIKISNVIVTQTYKTIILTGTGIVESLLHYLLVKEKLHSRTEWNLKVILPGQQKSVEGIQTKVDSHIYNKLSAPKRVSMNFDSIIQKSKKGKVLGSNSDIYKRINSLRKLRNKVHLQAINHPIDTDWNSFNKSNVKTMDEVLYAVFTGVIFKPNNDQKEYFKYLNNYAESN